MPTFKSFEEIESWQKARERRSRAGRKLVNLHGKFTRFRIKAPLQRISVCVIKFEEQVFRL